MRAQDIEIADGSPTEGIANSCKPTCGGYQSGTCCNDEECKYLPGPIGAYVCE